MVAVWILRSTPVVVHDVLEGSGVRERLPWEVKVSQLDEQYYAVWVPSRQESGQLQARAVWFTRYVMAEELLHAENHGVQTFSPMIVAPSVEEASMYYHLGVRIPAHMHHVTDLTPESRFSFEPLP